MSFINSSAGHAYAPGYFLAHEECTRKTYGFSAEGEYVVTTDDGAAYVPMGTLIEDATLHMVGFVYEDVDVSAGDMPGSLVTKGVIYSNRLPKDVQEVVEDETQALFSLGFELLYEPTVTRPGAESDDDEGGGK